MPVAVGVAVAFVLMGTGTPTPGGACFAFPTKTGARLDKVLHHSSLGSQLCVPGVERGKNEVSVEGVHSLTSPRVLLVRVYPCRKIRLVWSSSSAAI